MKAIVNGKLVFPEKIEDGVLLIEGDKIVASGKVEIPEGAEIIDAKGLYVGPGFVDQHSHGYQQYGEGIEVKDDPVAVAMAHLKHGTTTYIPSTDYNFTYELQMKIIDMCNAAIEEDSSNIMGIHMEGPYINKKYGSHSELALTYDENQCEEMFARAAKNTKHCTYAPELPDAKKIEEKLCKYGIKGAIGHCGAGPEDIERAVANGARICTHLYDATGHFESIEAAAKLTQHPQDCTSDILLAIPDLYYELICDSQAMHVTKYSVIRTLRTAGEDHVVLISDATVRPAYRPDQPIDININEVGILSGSRLTISLAVKNFIKFTGCDHRVAFKAASTNSAKAMGLFDKVGSIDAGKLANLVFVDDDFTVQRIFFKGKELEEVRN